MGPSYQGLYIYIDVYIGHIVYILSDLNFIGLRHEFGESLFDNDSKQIVHFVIKMKLRFF